MKNYQTRILTALLLLPLANQGGKADEVPAVHTIRSPIDRVVIVRLKNKTDMLDGLKQAVAREKIKNAVLMSGFGSVTAYHTHVVSNTTFPPKDAFTKESGPLDLLNVSGMVIDGKVHAHITLSSTQKAIGGHLEPGTSVFTFATITLGILSDSIDLTRVDDFAWH
jgi:predicted DNA-binding protein with PD1-like motif